MGVRIWQLVVIPDPMAACPLVPYHLCKNGMPAPVFASYLASTPCIPLLMLVFKVLTLEQKQLVDFQADVGSLPLCRQSQLSQALSTIFELISPPPKLLSTQKKILHTEKLVGEVISRQITDFLLICPRSELISEICSFLCLEHGPTPQNAQ